MSGKRTLLEGYQIGGDRIDRIIVQAEEAGLAPEPVLQAPPAKAAGPTLHNTPMAVPFPGMELAEPLPEYPLEHRKDGLFDVFTKGDLEYRLGGIKPLFVTSLRVTIRAKCGERNYYDSLDLYLARGRTAFASSLERSLGAEPARVERDLARMLAFLETERDKALTASGTRSETMISEAERKAGMELLTDPALTSRIVNDLSALSYVGEDVNKLLVYVCATSRKRDQPLSVLILPQSASGKSYLVDCVRRLMPEDEVLAVTSMSDQALNYLTDLEHKFLILGEAVEYQLREMLSGKELSRLVVEKDPDSGRMESRMIKIPVIVSSVMGSTAGKVNPENASRCFVIHADESREQTERIHEYQRRRKCLDRLLEGKKKTETIIGTHKAAQKLLRNIPVVNDFAPLLDFPSTLMRSRRDHERFLDLIDCVCFLRQYQKPTEHSGGVSFIRCDSTDYEIAYRIMVEGVLTSTMEELPRGARLLYEQLRDWVRKMAQEKKIAVNDLRFTQRQVREATGLAHTWIKTMLHLLVDYEYLEQKAGSGERSRAWYTLCSDEAIRQGDLSMIPPPESIAKLATGH
jgi:hypothetical protein